MGEWIASQNQQTILKEQSVELSQVARLKRDEKMVEVRMDQLPSVREARQSGPVARRTESNLVRTDLQRETTQMTILLQGDSLADLAPTVGPEPQDLDLVSWKWFLILIDRQRISRSLRLVTTHLRRGEPVTAFPGAHEDQGVNEGERAAQGKTSRTVCRPFSRTWDRTDSYFHWMIATLPPSGPSITSHPIVYVAVVFEPRRVRVNRIARCRFNVRRSSRSNSSLSIRTLRTHPFGARPRAAHCIRRRRLSVKPPAQLARPARDIDRPRIGRHGSCGLPRGSVILLRHD